MRRVIAGVLAVALVLSLAGSAAAYDVLYTRRTAATHEAKTFGLDAYFYYFTADREYDENGNSVDLESGESVGVNTVPVDLYYSFTDRVEVGIIPRLVMPRTELLDDSDEIVTEDAVGVGDTWAYAQWMFKTQPAIAGLLSVKFPTGNDRPDPGERPTGTGQYDIDAAIAVDWPTRSGLFYGIAGYRWRGSTEVTEDSQTYNVTPGDEIHFMLGYTHYLSERMQLRFDADGYFGSDHDVEPARDTVPNSARNGIWINPAFEYVMASGLLLGADFHYPLTGQNIYALWGFGLYVGWSS
jgi:hypothetical protein